MTRILMAAIAATLALLGTPAQAADDSTTLVAVANTTSVAPSAAPAADAASVIKGVLTSSSDWTLTLGNLRYDTTFSIGKDGVVWAHMTRAGETKKTKVTVTEKGISHTASSGAQWTLEFNGTNFTGSYRSISGQTSGAMCNKA